MFIQTGFADEIHENLEVQIQSWKELGLLFMEIRGINKKNISEFSLDEAQTVKKLLRDHDIKVSSIASPIGKILINEDFKKHFLLFKKIVEIAKIMDTKYIRIFSFYLPKESDFNQYKDTVIERLKMMTDYASKQGIILLHENEKDIFGDISDRCLLLAKSIDHPNFRLVFDFANFIQCKIDPIDAWNKLKDYVDYFHIKDANANGEIVLPGEGIGKIDIILKEAIKNGFEGFISLEPHLVLFQGLQNLEINKEIKNFSENGFKEFKLAYSKLQNIIKLLY